MYPNATYYPQEQAQGPKYRNQSQEHGRNPILGVGYIEPVETNKMGGNSYGNIPRPGKVSKDVGLLDVQ